MLKEKPTLYVPDYRAYALPFTENFKIIHDEKRSYDIDLALKCDFLMLTGGADIHPKYYGHVPSARTQHWEGYTRDMLEHELAQACILADIPIIGICRGAQWLTILSGGSLIQHVTGHNGGTHKITTHEGEEYQVSSAHHQMCNLSGLDKNLIAWSDNVSTMYLGSGDKVLFPKGLTKEPEIFYLPQVRGFCVQGHPEFMPIDAPVNIYIRKTINEIYQI